MNLAFAQTKAGFRRVVCAGALLLAACTDDALLLGAKPEAATEMADASDGQDGDAAFEEQADDPPPLRARFQANGRLGVVRVEAPCPSDCIELSVVVEGGVPPYEVVWDDGKVGASHSLCVDPIRARSVTVSDARPGGAGLITLGLNAIRARNCGTSGEGFFTCFVPERRQVECAGGRREVFDLGTPTTPGRLLVELEYEPASQLVFQVDATFSETGCSEESPIAGWPMTLGSSGSSLIGSFAVDSLFTGAFLTFTTMAGLPIVPTLGIPLSVKWMEICEQASAP